MTDTLAPYAASDERSRGRRIPESPPQYRTEFQRDRDRIIHSSAFRRLEYKTQVFINHEGDMFRTRLTHSIEVAQIGRTVARALGLNEALVESVSLAHDVGHTPFGHAGQDTLNECMTGYGGFEHNLQSLRVVDELEERYAEFNGLNLTFETREGILKHCPKSRAKALGEVGERFLTGGQPSLEAQIANVADGIAYNNHDVDDGLRAGLISVEQLCETTFFREEYEAVIAAYPDLPGRRLVYEIVRRMIGRQVVDLVESSKLRLSRANPADIDAVRGESQPLIRFSDGMHQRHQELKRFLYHNLYRHYRVHRMMVKAQRVMRELFAAFLEDVRLLPPPYQAVVSRLEIEQGLPGRARVVADYIAGMTDRFALAEHRKLFSPPELT
ncbi:deoxyguanosinetriphosphate triphosphohydrolase [Thiohalomonas denitrificans]|uniref:Deoxyguanosinetriphosphate triphosphohydrolase-like protein n=1 Tax=Thiohalomonas denitrificans TaxID=415747 RepID=A0A1G5QWW4_9GAMM|nr:deoxyguanosinetriphosphate triphosphohydrolase [Thiohalomonas denitrificans]SCZ66237.1 dGTPase [Thiohalomonas denitrificans]